MDKAPLPELIFANAATSKTYQRQVQARRMRRIARGIYTPNLQDALEIIVQRNLFELIDDRFPGCVVSHRSAFEIGAPLKPHIYVTGPFKKERNLAYPGVVVHVLPGAGPIEGDTPFKRFYIAGQARNFLENLLPPRGPQQRRKTVPAADLERRLAEIVTSRGENTLNAIRDQAKRIAPGLGLEREAARLDSIVGALMGTHPGQAVSDQASIQLAQRKPYDMNRLRLFEALALALKDVHTPDFRPYPDIRGNVDVLHTFAFFEGYFSNFIEGTEFEVDEAKRVVFENLQIAHRTDDTHDILNTYLLVADTYEMSRTPASGAGFIELLKSRHKKILGHRKDQNPSTFKSLRNRAGSSRFVEPDLVEGTLLSAYDIYKDLRHALARAIFMQIAVSEIHPFDDGNGRLSRVMMNAELTAANECRIIIPTVYRDDYITALKAFSQAGEIAPVIRMLERAQGFSGSMEWSNYEAAKASLEKANAFTTDREGKLAFEEKRRERPRAQDR